MVSRFTVTHRAESFYIDYVNKTAPPYDMEHFHLHDDYEIYYLISGTRMYIIDEKEYVVPARHLVLINKGTIHKTATPDQPEHERVVINVQSQFIPGEIKHLLTTLFEKGPHILSLPPVKQQAVHSMMEHMLEEYLLNRTDRHVYLQTLLIELLIECARLLHNQRPLSARKVGTSGLTLYFDSDVQRITTFIHRHYMKAISSTDIASQLQVNMHQISKKFRQTTGLNITTYINTVRVHEAQRLLRESSKHVTQIAVDVGFTNPAHFYRVFKQHTGFSPSAYRNRHRENMH